MTPRDAFEREYSRWSPDMRPKTRERYQFDLLRWERLSGNQDCGDINTATFLNFREASIAAGHSASTTEGSIRTIKQILNILHKLRLLPEVPDSGKPRRMDPAEIEPPTLEEIESLYLSAGCAKWPRLAAVPPHEFWRAWIVLGLWTGLRMTDLTWGLGWEHIGDDAIKFRASKTSKQHSFPLCPIVSAHLEMMRCQPGDKVFGCARTADKVRREIRRLCDNAQISRDLTPHDFRRACITSWSMADGTAAMIVHGVGLPKVLGRYQERVAILRAAAERFPWPDAIREHASTLPAAAKLVSADIAERRREAMERARLDVPVMSPPDPSDWQFKLGWFAYRGHWFPMPSPARRAVLMELATSADPVPLSRIIEVIDASGRQSVLSPPDRARIIVSQVRQQLRKFLGLGETDDPIPCCTRGDGGAWMLHLPNDVTDAAA